ncbi:zinc-binding dehydrogenase [Mycolicibacterium porcinum]|uniref:zinc-binding dehydrogenase n=1 Tax=Mycolicibacterium porcinum TaxID=39693 RepID=UPI00330611F3
MPRAGRPPGRLPDRQAVALAEQGVVTFFIQDRLPLADAAEAWKISSTGQVRGKIILIP